MLLSEGQDRIRWSVARLGTLDPIGAQFDSFTSKRGAHETPTELVSSLDDDKIIDSLFVQRPCSDYASDATAEDDYFGIWLGLCFAAFEPDCGAVNADGSYQELDKSSKMGHYRRGCLGLVK